MKPHKFRTYLLFGQCAAILLPVLVASFFVSYNLRTALIEEATKKNYTLTKSESGRIEDFLERPLLFFATIKRESLWSHDQSFLKSRFEALLVEFPYLENVEILDPQGRVTQVIPSDPSILGVNKSDFPHIQETLKTGRTIFSSSFISLETGEAAVNIAYKTKFFIIHARLNLELLSAMVVDFLRNLSPSFEMIVTDAQGVYLGSKNVDRVFQRETFLPFRNILMDREQEKIVSLEKNSGRLVTGVEMKTSGWFVFLLQPVSEAISSLYNFYILLSVIVLITLLIIFLITFLWAGILDRSLVTLTQAYQSITEGRFDQNPVNYQLKEFDTLNKSLLMMVEKITHREDENRKQMEELEVKNSELERFTYTVSHDLKSPLITMKGFLGHLRIDWTQQNENRFLEDLQRIEKATEKMQELLEDLLHLSRTSHTLERLQVFYMHTAFKAAMGNVHHNFADGELTYKKEPWPEIRGDLSRFIEVWQNLLENALKFKGYRNPIKLEAGWENREGEIVYYLKDNGIGINPLYHKKIFGLFEKLDPGAEGSGIGLALVKRILEMHRGHIWVESSGMGEGSTFYFALKTDTSPPSLN